MRRILYIAGARHCGSTILDLLLGQHAEVASLGQAAAAYRVFDDTERCTCGETLSGCPVWGGALGRLSPADRELLRVEGPRILRERRLPAFLVSRPARRAYVRPFDRLYDELFELTGAEVLVDSSKNVARAVALLRESRYPISVLHVVRDSRGMINSHNRRRTTTTYVAPMGEWLLKNGLGSAVLRPIAGSRYHAVHYENLVLQPEATLDRIGDALGLDLGGLVDLVRRGEDFAPQHIFRGNRDVRASPAAFDADRLASQRLDGGVNRRFWALGGAVTRLWGYDREQSYLRGMPVGG